MRALCEFGIFTGRRWVGKAGGREDISSILLRTRFTIFYFPSDNMKENSTRYPTMFTFCVIVLETQQLINKALSSQTVRAIPIILYYIKNVEWQTDAITPSVNQQISDHVPLEGYCKTASPRWMENGNVIHKVNTPNRWDRRLLKKIR